MEKKKFFLNVWFFSNLSNFMAKILLLNKCTFIFFCSWSSSGRFGNFFTKIIQYIEKINFNSGTVVFMKAWGWSCFGGGGNDHGVIDGFPRWCGWRLGRVMTIIGDDDTGTDIIRFRWCRRRRCCWWRRGFWRRRCFDKVILIEIKVTLIAVTVILKIKMLMLLMLLMLTVVMVYRWSRRGRRGRRRR